VDLTQLLNRAKNGDDAARADIIRVAYDDLRRIARAQMHDERQNHTLSSTALVHEMALRLLEKGGVQAVNRAQFLAYAATAMRRVLIDHARTRGAQKRQGNRQQLKLDEALVAASEQSEDFLCINAALEKLAKVDPRSSQIVEMRYFGGMSYPDVAAALDVSISTVQREWKTAKAWLLCQIRRDEFA
jgi:RNA polymerase sigma-70 factor (ECF subfamily)